MNWGFCHPLISINQTLCKWQRFTWLHGWHGIPRQQGCVFQKSMKVICYSKNSWLLVSTLKTFSCRSVSDELKIICIFNVVKLWNVKVGGCFYSNKCGWFWALSCCPFPASFSHMLYICTLVSRLWPTNPTLLTLCPLYFFSCSWLPLMMKWMWLRSIILLTVVICLPLTA